MTSDLSSELAALGLPAPSEAAPAPAAPDATDLIHAAVRPLFASHPVKVDIGTSAMVGDMLEAHAALTFWAVRLEAELSRYGHKIAKVVPAPKVMIDDGYRIIDGIKHPMTREVPCPHKLITTSESAAEVTCRTCGTLVNAAWWVARHADSVELAERRFVETRKEQSQLIAENTELKAERKRLRDAVRRGKESVAKRRGKNAAETENDD